MQINRETLNQLIAPLRKYWHAYQTSKTTPPSTEEKIDSFPGEKEILRKPTMLVTDTRLAFIDPYDRTLKTYMFEHMISVNKVYYKPTAFLRALCKGLIITGILLLLITLIVDLLDNDSRGFVLVYIPAVLSLVIGLLVWRDMRPKYKVEWKMRDGSTDKIATELLFSAWLRNSKKKESGMDDLTRAMNEALSNKAWWPANNGLHARGDQPIIRASYNGIDQSLTDNGSRSVMPSDSEGKKHLKLVTENYQ